MFPKGGMSGMMKQAQKLQEKMAQAQEELVDLHAEGQSGGGMVTVVANGKKDIISVKIEPEVLEEDAEMLEDLILAAVNQALENASNAAEDKMNSITGGMLGNMKIPGM
ncbi:MAG: YbaB/EbfC family nucleoid-associated protein [Candidatus Marinimicrobia bacterium]|nr:YbaB/EbfC family nucleoid-associated protein [Candidatus Neomarinimicrobiota bacterium]MBL7023624.1 YbaB/EbfC family nucleoid-associated protein [Candidatus Neomarinimicrobiota bacterium]MBL7109811.1 YbaB/EbfC family nucleoid-associated protein [Candidatus Neomarinimicrobiota bacterium]